MADRAAMDKALKSLVVPYLRKIELKGRYPQYRRAGPEFYELLMFWFDKYGGSFIVEIGRCRTAGFTTGWGVTIPPMKVKVIDVTARYRL